MQDLCVPLFNQRRSGKTLKGSCSVAEEEGIVYGVFSARERKDHRKKFPAGMDADTKLAIEPPE